MGEADERTLLESGRFEILHAELRTIVSSLSGTTFRPTIIGNCREFRNRRKRRGKFP